MRFLVSFYKEAREQHMLKLSRCIATGAGGGILRTIRVPNLEGHGAKL